MSDLLHSFAAADVLSPLDVQFARAMGRLGGESRPELLLACALTSRATRSGSVCLDLDDIRARLDAQRDTSQDEPLPWPEPWPPTPDGPLIAPPGGHPGVDSNGSPVALARPLVLYAGRLYLWRYFTYEHTLAQQLTARVTDDTGVRADELRPILDRLFPPSGHSLDRARLGAAMAATRHFAVISGGPGTGKTTTIKRLLAALVELAASDHAQPTLRIALAAPTGKAAGRMKQALLDGLDDLDTTPGAREQLRRLEASTLHSLLRPVAGNFTRFRRNAANPLPYDVVVVDEASMVDLALMAKLVDAVAPQTRLVLLGDRNQLASVESGTVLGDMCGPGDGVVQLSPSARERLAKLVDGLGGDSAHATPTQPGIWDCIVQLDRFWRFGTDSGIGGVARAIQRGGEAGIDDTIAFLRRKRTEQPGAAPYTDVTLTAPSAAGQLTDAQRTTLTLGYRPTVDAVLRGDPPARCLELLRGFRLLAAHRRGPLGVDGLNATVERVLDARVDGFDPSATHYLGRPILITRNDKALRLHNGDVGLVVRHPNEPDRFVVAFEDDGGVRLIPPGRLPEHSTVWAMTIHKSQGSQFEHAVVVLPTRASPILTRELIYTAITRARAHATVIAREPVLRTALATQVQRASGLRDTLWPQP